MNHHHLKILEQHYNNVKAGTKTFEIRVNDRGFQRGDLVTLRAFDPDWTGSSGRGAYMSSVRNNGDEHYPDLTFKIGDVYPIDSERVVFSLLKTGEKPEGEK